MSGLEKPVQGKMAAQNMVLTGQVPMRKVCSDTSHEWGLTVCRTCGGNPEQEPYLSEESQP